MKRERLLDRLSPEAREAMPVSYHLAESCEPGEASAVRAAESRFHRSSGFECSGFECQPFHKPISRTLGPEAPEKQ